MAFLKMLHLFSCLTKIKALKHMCFKAFGGDGGIRTHGPAHHRSNDFESFSL